MRQKESIGELTFYDLESRFYHWYRGADFETAIKQDRELSRIALEIAENPGFIPHVFLYAGKVIAGMDNLRALYAVYNYLQKGKFSKGIVCGYDLALSALHSIPVESFSTLNKNDFINLKNWYITNLKRKFSEIEQNFFT